MAKKTDLLNSNKPTGHVSRNGFDSSAARTYAMRPAVLRPVFVQHTVPNSSFKINAADIIRADALQTAAFVRGKQELDFYFIPYSMLNSNAAKIIMKRGDQISPGITISDTEFQTTDLLGLYQWSLIPYVLYRFLQTWRANVFTHSPLALQQIIGIFVDKFLDRNDLSSDQQSLHECLQYCCYNDISVFEFGSVATPQFLDSIEYIGADCIQLLATLGYGDNYEYVKQIYDQFEQDFINSIQGQVQTQDLEQFMSDIRSVFGHYLTSIDQGYNDSWNTMEGGRRVNLIPLIAYQKIWNDHYRDSINDESLIYNQASSMDWFQSGSFPVNTGQTLFPYGARNLLISFLRPHTRMYRKDLATGLYASPQFGSEGSLSLESVSIVNGYLPNQTASAYISDTNGRLFNSANNNDSWTVPNATSAYAIKLAFAQQKYREMLLRAGNRTKDVLMAEFGVKSQYIDEHYSRYLGSFDGSLDLNKVSATSDTGEYTVGDLAANLFSNLSGKEIDFTCNDYGLIVGVMSFLPDPVHPAFGVDAMNIKSTSDEFYHEAFSNLGLQPVSSERFALVAFNVNGEPVDGATTLGFAARDIEYKQNLDLCFDNFVSAPLYTNRFLLYCKNTHNIVLSSADGSQSNYVISKNVRQTLSIMKTRSYLMPSCMDQIFDSLDSGDPDHAHFKVQLQINMSSVLPMPVLGLM